MGEQAAARRSGPARGPGSTRRASSRARRSPSPGSRPGTRTRCSSSSAVTGRLVLRRPPRTPLSPTAHDMAREHRLLTAFAEHGADVPVPQPVALCTDPEVIGAPFYLMERLEGIVVRDALPDAVRRRRRRRRPRSSHSLVDLLAGDARVRLAGRRARRVRQARRATSTARCRAGSASWRSTRPARSPRSRRRDAWLAAHTPAMQDPTVIHGDYKLDNVMFEPDAAGPAARGARLGAGHDRRPARRPRLAARAVGRRGRGRRRSSAAANVALLGHGPVPSRAELADRYAAATGRDLTQPRVLLRARPVQARVRDGGLVRPLHRGHERRRDVRLPRSRRPRPRATRPRVHLSPRSFRRDCAAPGDRATRTETSDRVSRRR